MEEVDKENLPKILIIDSDDEHLESLKKILSKLKVSIYEINSGDKAFSLLLRHEFILILLDVKMFGMDAQEIAQLILDNKKNNHIPVICMTTNNKDESQINQGYNLSAIDCLSKPINKDILLSKVEIFLHCFNKEKKGEKEKIQEELVNQLEEKNRELQKSQLAALNMMEDANEARAALVKLQAKELEQFAYTATHDLKTPINNIESYLTFLKKDTTINSEKSLIAIEWIDKSVDHCKKLIQNLVTVVKIKEESSFDISSIDVGSILKTVLGLLQSEIKQSKARINVDFKRCPKIRYSVPHLESLLLNLLSNAIKYRSSNRALEINISTVNEDGYSLLSVQDNGIGINVNRDREKVFGLFKRAHKDTDGTGMGIYIVNETLKKFGGKIELKSEVDKGATFMVYFKH